MQAAIIKDYSDSFNALAVEQTAKPTPAAGQAVVKIHYASINPVDTMIIKGVLKDAWKTPLPLTLGYDFSGTIDSLHKDEKSSFAVGDDVFAVNWGAHSHTTEPTVGGAFAEYILVSLDKLSKKPAGISHQQAAASALVGTTAHQVVNDCAAVSKDQKVLILGGAGSVGNFAIQFAKAAGAFVATTASPRSAEFVKSLGADRIINYREEKWFEQSDLKDFDAVLDLVGEADSRDQALNNKVLKPNGRFVTIVNHALGFDPKCHPTLAFGSSYVLKNDPQVQDTLANGLASGSLKMRLDKEFPFTTEGVRDMMAHQASGKTSGKVTLKIA